MLRECVGGWIPALYSERKVQLELRTAGNQGSLTGVNRAKSTPAPVNIARV